MSVDQNSSACHVTAVQQCHGVWVPQNYNYH